MFSKLINMIVKPIVYLLIKRAEKNNNIFYITGGADQKTVYLVRYILWKSYWFGCCYIHRFVRSDADIPHDHPWNFYTYIVDGYYTEAFFERKSVQTDDGKQFVSFFKPKLNIRKPGSLAYRKATDVHKVIAPKEIHISVDDPEEVKRDKMKPAPLTICLMGPRLREWGFWSMDGSEFTDWRKYLDIKPGDHRIVGGE